MPPDTIPDFQDIQLQIQERGSFCPIQWLIETGHLPYSRYEAWRYGEIDNLSEAIGEDSAALKAVMNGIADQAQALELAEETQAYYDWRPEHAERPLHFSKDADLAALLGKRWLRPQDLPQLDLFMDSGTASAENGLIDALNERQWEKAEQAFHTLCEVAPNHAQLGRFETLVLYGKHLAANPTLTTESIEDELEGLEQDIAPLANELLGTRARDYLALAWQRIGHALTALPKPPRHPSYAWAQIPDWQAVIDSIDAAQIGDTETDLLARLTQALYFGGHPEQAIVAGARLFEIDPKYAISALTFLPSIDSLWQTFHDGDEPHPPSHFPAWLLLHHPGLIHHLHDDYPTPRSEPFQACAQLLRKRLEKADEIAAREQLQGISPGLLRVYFGLNVAA